MALVFIWNCAKQGFGFGLFRFVQRNNFFGAEILQSQLTHNHRHQQREYDTPQGDVTRAHL